MDQGDWLCLQCGRYYYTRLNELRPNQQPERPNIPDQPPFHHQVSNGQGQEKAVLPAQPVAGPTPTPNTTIMANGYFIPRHIKTLTPVQYLGTTD